MSECGSKRWCIWVCWSSKTAESFAKQKTLYSKKWSSIFSTPFVRDHHWAQKYTRSWYKTTCCCVASAAEWLTFSLITFSTPPLLLNNWAYGLPCLPQRPQKSGTRPAVHQGPTWWRNTSCWSPSNLMITITCSPSEAPYSLWFLSNWSVPFAWLIWLLHFSLSLSCDCRGTTGAGFH